jgi:rhodanese-related sulfurtransferase/DNA-directed RNA polymerase subunit RPC12/RpoP
MKKTVAITSIVITLFVLFTAWKCISHAQDSRIHTQQEYVCLPCGAACDTILHKNPGTCSHCSMELVKRSTIKHSDISPRELCSFIKKTGEDNVLLLDVRTPAEFNGTAELKYGRLKNAINIPVQELPARMKELETWKDKQIVVYCSHSHRSPRASYMLSQNGFTKVTNMAGGMSAWGDSVKDTKCNENLFVRQ